MSDALTPEEAYADDRSTMTALTPEEAYGNGRPNVLPPPSKPDMPSKLYHAVFEGGATTLGGMAGGAIGTLADPVAGPAGSVAGAVAGAGAFYPAGKYLADAIDGIRGMTTEQQSLGQQMMEGAETEAMGQGIGALAKPAGELLGKVLPGAATGEAISGTPKRNLSRAFKNGFTDTFISPTSLQDASDIYGKEYTRLMGDYFSPAQQADLLLNPNGISKDSLNIAIQKSLYGQEPTIQEAIAAKQGISQLMPSQTAKSLPRVRGFSDFRDYLNDIISKKDPEFKAANDVYAAAKLRDQLLMFGMVNKSNPNEYSKLGKMIFGSMGVMTGLGTESFKDAALAYGSQVASSPFVMGLISAASGDASRAAMKALSNPLVQRATASALTDYFEQNGEGSPKSNSLLPGENPADHRSSSPGESVSQ